MQGKEKVKNLFFTCWIYLRKYLLSFLNFEIVQIAEINSSGRQIFTVHTIDIMADDGQATQGARALAAMVWT